MAIVRLGVEPSLFGEKSVLENLSLLPDEWQVFYSLGFIDRNGFDRQREIDFVAFHPERGLVFIEVKGGSVSFENGKVSVGLEFIPKESPFYNLEGKDNIVLFYTDRYVDQPLLIKGAGAGAAVTASGIFADVIRIGNV